MAVLAQYIALPHELREGFEYQRRRRQRALIRIEFDPAGFVDLLTRRIVRRLLRDTVEEIR